MHAEKVKGSGRRRLLTLLTAILAIVVTLSFGLMRAHAGTLQLTTTSISITDASTGNPIGSSIPSTELVTLTATVTGTSSAPTGLIAFQTTTDGVHYTPICDSGGNCSWSVSPTGALTSQGSVTIYLPAGTYDIQASFQGTGGSINSSSLRPGIPVTVTAITVHNTTTAVAANPNAITTGQSTTITATVSADDGSGTPSGMVTFYALVGQVRTFIAQATLNASGQASFSSSAWAAQTYQIEADYAGRVFVDPNGNTVSYQTSAGTAILNVAAQSNPQVATSTSVIATPNPIRNDQSVHVVATVVQSGASTIAGATLGSTVTFTAVGQSGNAVLGTAQLIPNGDGTGTAVLDKGGWIPGTYTITAQYFGNIYFLGSSGSTSTIVVNQARTSATTYIHDTQTYVGDNAILSAQVIDQVTHQPVPAGEIVALTASDTAGTGCLGATDSNGIASCPVQFPAPGTFVVTASYGGDSTYDPSTGFGQITVLQVPTNVTVTAAPNPVPTGVSDTLTGHLTDARTGNPVAGKSLTLTLNNNETCTATTNASGNASCAVTVSEGNGAYQASASFAGDGSNGQYLPSSGNGTLQVVNVLPTNWRYTGTASVFAGQPATISFVLTDGSGQVMANRHATLSLNGTSYPVTTDANGVVTQTVTAPTTAGSYSPTASYGGETGYQASSGSGSLQVNTIPTNLTYTGSTTVSGGTSATISFVLADVNGTPLGGRTVTLALPGGGNFTGPTNASGVISDTITAPTPSVNTTYTPSASFGGSLPYLASTGNGSLQVNVVPTAVTYTGDTSVNAGQPAHISFLLTNSATGAVLAGMPVTLTLPNGSHYATTTDANGVASTTVTAPATTGSFPVSESFAGQAQYLPSTGNGALVVTTIPTSVTYVGDATVAQGGTANLSAQLLDNSGNPLANEHLTLTLATGETCTGITNASGVASCQVVVSEPTTLAGSPYNVSISFGGDLPYVPSTGNGALAVTAQYTAPAAGFCSSNKCESLIANPKILSPTQLQVLYADDSALPTSASLAPTAVLDAGRQLVVATTATSGVTPTYVDTYGGSMSTKYEDLINISIPAGLTAGSHTIRVFTYDGDGDWDQWTWSITVAANGTVTSNAGAGNTLTSHISSVTANFQGTAVPAGDTLWFTSAFKVSGLPATDATITFTNQTITIGSTTIAVPNSEIDFSPTATTATTSFESDEGDFDTVVPAKLGGNIFGSGVGYVLPAALAGNLKSVVWSATISSNAPGVTVSWAWGAAAYSSFSTDPTALGIKPVDDGKASVYQNGDKAGSPENSKAKVVAGGTGGGGSSYTGSLAGMIAVKF